jgi:hypothetical protein
MLLEEANYIVEFKENIDSPKVGNSYRSDKNFLLSFAKS